MPVGAARLPASAARAHARHALEVGNEHDSSSAACDVLDLLVDDALRVDGPLPFRRVAVVHDHIWNVAGVADAREERHVPLAAAFEDEDAFLVRLDAERVEHERERELLGAALDEQHCTCEEELRAVAVELREHAERLRLGERLRLEERRAVVIRVSHEREVFDAVDAEEDRSVGRVEDLVAAMRELAHDTEEVPLQVRAQVELRLLDEEDEAAQVRREQSFHPRDELQAAVRLRPVVLGVRRLEELGDVGRPDTGGGRDEVPRAQVRRQEEHGGRAGAVQVERVGRRRVEEDRVALLELGLQMDAPRRAARDVLDRRRRCGSLEQRPDGSEHGRLAARCLTDERAHRPGLELEVARRAVALHGDPLEWRHLLGCPERAEVHGRVAGHPAPEEALDRRVQHDVFESDGSKRRCPRTAESLEVTASSERPERSPAKMMCTTCLDASARTGEIESTSATGPSTGISSSMPTSSRSSRWSASTRLSPEFTPPPGSSQYSPRPSFS